MNFRERIKDANRIVIKVGTSTVTYKNGNINLERIENLAKVIAGIVNSGKEAVLVTSGAVGAGIGKLRLKEKPGNVREKQALSAIGQCELMHNYSKFFGEYSHIVGQIWLTRDIIEDEHIKENVCNTFELLLKKNVIPIVNENDSVSIDELENIVKFGDNDNLSAIVSSLINADLLIILSDIDGFYDCDPRKNKDAKLIKEIQNFTEELEKYAGDTGSDLGTGGMATKIKAAKVATAAGVDVILANGKDPCIVRNILRGEDVGTLFVAKNRGNIKWKI